MKEQLRPGRGFLYHDACVCVTIDVQDRVGISLAERDRLLRKVESDQQSLSSRHGEMSGHSERGRDFSGSSPCLHARLEALVGRCRQACNNAQDSRHDHQLRKALSGCRREAGD